MHDWSKVPAGIYHDFHCSWIMDLKRAVNQGLLPQGYYPLGEQQSGDVSPDLLTLRSIGHGDIEVESDTATEADEWDSGGAIAVAEAPPKVRLAQEAGEDAFFYLARQRSLVFRHVSDDRIVALLEIVSPANKHTRQTLDDFVDKVVAALRDGIHVLIIDPLPQGHYDPDGIHGAVWSRLLAGDYEAPADSPLTMVSYRATRPIKAYVEPFHVGSRLTDMPMFLSASRYIPMPLETTYQQSWEGVPQRWRRVIEGDSLPAI